MILYNKFFVFVYQCLFSLYHHRCTTLFDQKKKTDSVFVKALAGSALKNPNMMVTFIIHGGPKFQPKCTINQWQPLSPSCHHSGHLHHLYLPFFWSSPSSLFNNHRDRHDHHHLHHLEHHHLHHSTIILFPMIIMITTILIILLIIRHSWERTGSADWPTLSRCQTNTGRRSYQYQILPPPKKRRKEITKYLKTITKNK